MSLLQRVYKELNVVIPEGTSIKAAVRELNKRGKLADPANLSKLLFLVIEEVEELKAVKAKK